MSAPEDEIFTDEAGPSSPNAASFARRSPRITRDDVLRAADALLLEGQRPTIDRVRMRLGRGSPNTINDHLDAWWAKLGSRLRDLPGQTFPQLPERVAQSIQQLWTEALESAQESLRGTLAQRESELAQREQALEAREQAIGARERAATGHPAAGQESLTLALEQLSVANHSLEELQAALRERDASEAQSRAWIEALDASCEELQRRLQTTADAHQTERRELQERHATAEARFQREIDQARQALKDAEQQHQQALGELRQRITQVKGERDRLLQERDQRQTPAGPSAAALEENLRLAREQLALANHTIEELQTALRERDAAEAQSRSWIEALDASCEELQRRIQSLTTANDSERREMQTQHAAEDVRLRHEIDEIRQALKEERQAYQRELDALRLQTTPLQDERDQLRLALAEANGRLQAAAAVREQIESLLHTKRKKT